MFRRRIVVLTIFLFSHRAFSQEFLSLEDAIQLAVRNNYEINKQQYAIDAAKAQYMQVSGALDFEVGAEASYSQKHTPVDKDDPNYKKDYEIGTDRPRERCLCKSCFHSVCNQNFRTR